MTAANWWAPSAESLHHSHDIDFRSLRWRTGIGYLALFLVVHAALAETTNGWTLPDIVDLILTGASAALLSLPRRLNRRIAWLVVIALLAASFTGTWALPQGPAAQGYVSWHFGAITFVALGLALRGYRVAAWSAYVGMSAVAIAWAISTGQGGLPGINLVDRHFATLLVGTVFAVALDRLGRRERAFLALERRERAADRAAEVSRLSRHAAALQVLEQAGPMLRAIADGHRFSAAERRELLVVEGAVRDQIRTPALLTTDLKERVAAARRRGVSVLLLDESVDPTPAAIERATTWLASRLDGVASEGFVGRVRGAGDDLRVTAVAGDDQASLKLR